MIGDSIHNFVDGVVIAGTFLVSTELGIITALAVAAHEIPQEIGDFGILISRGLKRTKVILINFFSALASLVGALLFLSLGESVANSLPIFLSVTAGFFIYIALSDLIPEIHSRENNKVAMIEAGLLLFGVFIIYFLVSLLEGAH